MMERNTLPVGLVLAGGAGRRMGRDKGAILLGGRTLALAAAERLDELCGSVCISLAHGGANPAPGFPVIEDLPGEPLGPLGGIARAFHAVGERDLLVLACDYPRVRVELLRSLLRLGGEGDDVTMACGARDHPLVALWRRSSREALDQAVNAGALRVLDLVERLRVRRVDAEQSALADHEQQLLNVNRPEDLAALDLESGQ
jgi:molybdopterin-guanine dinucleotide biosynthesis protein A